MKLINYPSLVKQFKKLKEEMKIESEAKTETESKEESKEEPKKEKELKEGVREEVKGKLDKKPKNEMPKEDEEPIEDQVKIKLTDINEEIYKRIAEGKSKMSRKIPKERAKELLHTEMHLHYIYKMLSIDDQKLGIQSRVILLNQPSLQFEPQPEIEPESPIELLAKRKSKKKRVKGD